MPTVKRPKRPRRASEAEREARRRELDAALRALDPLAEKLGSLDLETSSSWRQLANASGRFEVADERDLIEPWTRPQVGDSLRVIAREVEALEEQESELVARLWSDVVGEFEGTRDARGAIADLRQRVRALQLARRQLRQLRQGGVR